MEGTNPLWCWWLERVVVFFLARTFGVVRSSRVDCVLHLRKNALEGIILAVSGIGKDRTLQGFIEDALEPAVKIDFVLVWIVLGAEGVLNNQHGNAGNARIDDFVRTSIHLRLVEVQIFEQVGNAIGPGETKRTLTGNKTASGVYSDGAGESFGVAQRTQNAQLAAIVEVNVDGCHEERRHSIDG